jgi:hypothetical protein
LDNVQHPPEGVETVPDGHPTVSAAYAARRLGADVRTIRKMIVRRQLQGGAQPRPAKMRWYVYVDQLEVAFGRLLGAPGKLAAALSSSTDQPHLVAALDCVLRGLVV